LAGVCWASKAGSTRGAAGAAGGDEHGRLGLDPRGRSRTVVAAISVASLALLAWAISPCETTPAQQAVRSDGSGWQTWEPGRVDRHNSGSSVRGLHGRLVRNLQSTRKRAGTPRIAGRAGAEERRCRCRAGPGATRPSPPRWPSWAARRCRLRVLRRNTPPVVLSEVLSG
jgi:hypothetical protein